MMKAARISTLTGLLVALLLTSGCAASGRTSALDARGPVWPEGPETARIRYLGSVTRPADIGARGSLWDSIVRVFAGADEQGMDRPMAVAVSADGERIYVTDSGLGCVHVFDIGQRRYARLWRGRNEPFVSPVGLAIAPSGQLWVADSYLGEVFTARPGDRGFSRFTEDVSQPTGIAWDAANETLLVVDTPQHEILAFDTAGQRVRQFGARGAQPGALNFPTYVWRGDDDVIVSDTLNFRIQTFSQQRADVRAFGDSGGVSGRFLRPKGVAEDSDGNIYVIDALLPALQIFDHQGALLLALGQQGQGPGEFWLPSGIFIDGGDRIFVADTYNRRVQVFQYLRDDQ